MKQDKNNERRDYDECSCNGMDAHNSENDENSDGWQTIQEEDCCSCCSTTELTRDEDTNTPNRDSANGTLAEQTFPDCCEKYASKESKNGRSKNIRLRRNVFASEDGQCSSREARHTSDLNKDCACCQERSFTQENSRRRTRDDAQEYRNRPCSCVNESKKTHRKRSRTHKGKSKREKQTASRTCSCITVQDMNYCTCPGYSNNSEAQRNIQPSTSVDYTQCSDAPEIRYNNVSCQTCQTEDIDNGRETILLPRVALRTTEDRDDCEQCRRERVMFDRLSDQTVQSTIDETFRKLIRKTLEMYPAAQRAVQPANNNLNYRPLMNNNVVSLLPQQPSLGMELCTCALKSYNQSEATCTAGPCRDCQEVPTNCTCVECTDFQGNESCEECAKENMECNTCKLCVNDEACEQCESDTDDNNDSSDSCSECCRCDCWKNDKPAKHDDFLP